MQAFTVSQIKYCCLAVLLIALSTSVYAKNSTLIGNIEHLDSLYKQQNYKAVINNLKQVAKADMSADHYRYLIYSYAETDLDAAERVAEQAISALPNEPDVYLMHASIMGSQASNSIFSALSYAQKAVNSLNKAIELAPNSIEYREALVSFHLNAPSIAGGDTDIALQQIKIIEGMDVIQGKVNLAWYYRTIDNVPASLAVLQQANLDVPNNISVLNALASHYLSEDNFEKAIDAFIELAAIDLIRRPFEDEIGVLEAYDESRYRQLNAHYQIGRIALLGNTRLDEGISHMQIFIDTLQNPDAIGVMDTAGLPSINWAYLRLSGLLLANNEKVKSIDAFKRIDLDKNDNSMAKIHSKLKKQFK
ncbi:tetratricopeptide repeat protein [Glaciecola sp. SC05]|uniref:tetratricopeptide repeat protein n=1 Tax=Glaciecola sp. SC05 TaxID=1987355 RepID=UPI003527C0CF